MQTDTVGDGATAAGGGLESLTYANTAVVVTDLDRAIEWYGRHLGFTERARVRIDGANVALLEGAGTQLEFLQYDDGSVTTVPSLRRHVVTACTTVTSSGDRTNRYNSATLR
jgi:catechol 2,3-dioxygenase-like lactoylglutathione lyase family enzyme